MKWIFNFVAFEMILRSLGFIKKPPFRIFFGSSRFLISEAEDHRNPPLVDFKIHYKPFMFFELAMLSEVTIWPSSWRLHRPITPGSGSAHISVRLCAMILSTNAVGNNINNMLIIHDKNCFQGGKLSGKVSYEDVILTWLVPRYPGNFCGNF
jgi:hypothetical protein